MFHTVAYGASKESENNLFIRALGQSPGPIITQAANQKLVSNAYLEALNVSSADEARRLPTEVLIQANQNVEASLGLWGQSSEIVGNVDSTDTHIRACCRW